MDESIESAENTKEQKGRIRFLMVGAVLLWLLFPMVMRCINLAINWNRGAISAGIMLSLFTGFLQDLLIFSQWAIIFLILVAVVRDRQKRWPIALAATLSFLLVQFWYFFDLLLSLKMKIKWSVQFVHFLKDIETFTGSVSMWEWLGLAAGILLVALAIIPLLRFWKALFVSRFSVPRTAGTIAGAALVGTIPFFLQPSRTYLTNNALFMDQYRAFLKLGTDDSGVEPMLTERPEEVYTVVNANYPLLRYTRTFQGDKSFDIRLQADERPHVIFLFMESYRAHDVGVLGSRHRATPNFDRLAAEGILFTQFYANGVQTARAVISSLYGIYPRMASMSAQADCPELRLIGVPHLFRARGYHTAYIHNGSLKFAGKDKFFPRQGFEAVHGRNHIQQRFPDATGSSWGLPDEYLMPYAADYLDQCERQKQPAFLTVFTVSNHHPWHVPADFAIPDFLPDNPRSMRNHFLKSMAYTDHCLGLFVSQLEERGLYDKVVLFILADTSQPMGEHQDNYVQVNAAFEENFRIPLLILAPGRIAAPTKIAEPASQVDLLPTVMDVFGFSALNHAEGRSLARRRENHMVIANNPFGVGHVVIRKGAEKFVYSGLGQPLALYNLDADPDETDNLAAQYPGRVSGYMTLVRQHLHSHGIELYPNNRFLDPDTHRRLREDPTSILATSRDRIERPKQKK